MKRGLLSLTILLAALLPAAASAVDASISSEQYATGGLFANPLIPGQNEEVTIAVRATIEGDAPSSVPCRLTITASDASMLQALRRQLPGLAAR